MPTRFRESATTLSRRSFLAASTGALAAASGVGRARAQEPARGGGSTSPNEAITLGFIGVGGMGTGLLNIFKEFNDVRVAAVCDVYEPNALRAKDLVGGKPDVLGDFRRVLDRKDIDAVVIATPDHWHAIPTILACQAGKDIYCEKPLAYRIGEGRRVVDAAAKYKRVTQMGNLIHATDNYHRIAEIVQSGCLGTIRKARFWMARPMDDSLGHPPDSAPPAGADYDFWLGPAPERAFNPNRFQFKWRFFWDYAGGMFADFVCHLLDPIHWGMQAVAPATVAATGGRYVLDDNGETPDTMEAVYHYDGDGDDPGWDLIWSLQTGNTHGFHDRSAGVEFVGTKGTLHGHYRDHVILPNEGEEIEEPEPFLPRSQGHHREWLDKIRTREQCSCNFGYGHQLSNVAHLGNIGLWTGEKLAWDADNERITNCEEANRYLLRETYRAPGRCRRSDIVTWGTLREERPRSPIVSAITPREPHLPAARLTGPPSRAGSFRHERETR